jgi:hypothetical protein
MADAPAPPSPVRRFFFDYGFFLDAFTSFDCLIELLLKQQLRLTNEEASITFCSVGFGAKFAVLCALLSRDPSDKLKMNLLRAANRAADRNGFVHGFLIPSAQYTKFTHVRREVRTGYGVPIKHMTAETMNAHAKAFYDAVNGLLSVCGLTHDDVLSYQKWIAENAPKSAIPANSRPRQSSSKRAKPNRRGRAPDHE